MKLSLTLKTQNMRSFNLSSNDGFFKNKVKAATLEQDNILILTNTQVGNKANMLTKEFNLELLNSSTHIDMNGVSIVLKITKIIKVMDARSKNRQGRKDHCLETNDK